MIISVTSKRGGVGCTTLAITLSLVMSKMNKSVCLVELNSSQDYSKLLNLNSSKGIDSLITEIGFNSEYTNIDDYLYKYDSLDVLLGTRVDMQRYLYNRSERIKDLLQALDEKYDLVVIDITDEKLYEELRELDVRMYPVHVLEQNMLVAIEYRSDMKKSSLDGLIVVNKLDNDIYPAQKLFSKVFPDTEIVYLPFSNSLRNFNNLTIRNKGSVPLVSLVKESFYPEIKNLCSKLITLSDNYNSAKKSCTEDLDSFFSNLEPRKKQEKKKSGFGFISIFRKKGSENRWIYM